MQRLNRAASNKAGYPALAISSLNLVNGFGRQAGLIEREIKGSNEIFHLPINHLHKGKTFILSPEYFSSAL